MKAFVEKIVASGVELTLRKVSGWITISSILTKPIKVLMSLLHSFLKIHQMDFEIYVRRGAKEKNNGCINKEKLEICKL